MISASPHKSSLLNGKVRITLNNLSPFKVIFTYNNDKPLENWVLIVLHCFSKTLHSPDQKHSVRC